MKSNRYSTRGICLSKTHILKAAPSLPSNHFYTLVRPVLGPITLKSPSLCLRPALVFPVLTLLLNFTAGSGWSCATSPDQQHLLMLLRSLPALALSCTTSKQPETLPFSQHSRTSRWLSSTAHGSESQPRHCDGDVRD